MASELNNDKDRVDEGYTEFSSRDSRHGPYFYPTGRLGRWLARFFGSKTQPYVSTQGDPEPTQLHPLAGDAVSTEKVIKAGGISSWGKNANSQPILPELEASRKKRYQELESMDEYPEIGSAFDIYADDCTQKDVRNVRWNVMSESKFVVDEVNELFQTLRFDREYWDIFRNTIKYGDCFIETIFDVKRPKEGLKRIKILNPNYVLRVENEYGYLTDFLQEIPSDKDSYESFGVNAANMKNSKYITLDKNQIVHFRLKTADPQYYPYGKSIAAAAFRVYRSLKMMEDAMLIYRLARAPERRVFYIDISGIPANKANVYIEKIKEKFKKEKFYDQGRGQVGARYNPLAADEDFFVPIKGNQSTKIDTLPGADNLGEVDDVRYFRDKLLASLKIPKDYVVEKDKSPERKANLSQLDVKFARTIARIQNDLEEGMERIAKRHLQLKGFPKFLINKLRIELPDPSDMFTKRKLDVDDQKARVVQAVIGTGLFPKNQVYKEYYNMTDSEIAIVKDQLEKEQQEEALLQQQADPNAATPNMPIGGMEEDPTMGMEPQENIPPTENVAESNVDPLNTLQESVSYAKKQVLERIIKKRTENV